MLGVLTLILITSGGLVYWLGARTDEASPTITSATPSPEPSTSPLNPDFVHAPSDVQTCLAAIIGTDALTKLVEGQRPPNQGEHDALVTCFRPSVSPSSAPTAAATHPSPAASPAKSQAQSAFSSSSPTSSSAAASPTVDIHPEVWTKNGYDGASYEYKVNCGPNYPTLETCFLWEVTRVVVTAPSGITYELNKDFNINSYSGEVTRRWVLYGPPGGGLPTAGTYAFTYYTGVAVVHTQTLNYTPTVIEAPTNITWRRAGNNLIVDWTPPPGMTADMSYKVIIFRPSGVLSQLVSWDAMTATLENVPLATGETVTMNVSSYFPGGYAYPASVTVTW